MLKTAEERIKKSSSHVMMVQKDSKKRKHKAKAKASDEISSSKPKPIEKSKACPAGSDACHYCHKPGHWRRNCKLYLKELKKKKGSKTSTLGINVI